MGLMPTDDTAERTTLMPYAGLAELLQPVGLYHRNGDLPLHPASRAHRGIHPRTVPIPTHRRTRLGENAPELGVDFIVGSQVRDELGKFARGARPAGSGHIHARPAGPADLPYGRRIGRTGLRDPLAFDIHLGLRRALPRPLCWGKHGSAGPVGSIPHRPREEECPFADLPPTASPRRCRLESRPVRLTLSAAP